MTVKLIGSILVIAGCGGFGFSLAAAQLREERSLRELIYAVETMECELNYRLTPLPDLCRVVCRQIGGEVGQLFQALADSLDTQLCTDVRKCMDDVLRQTKTLSPRVISLLRRMGSTLGRYDSEGQKTEFHAFHKECTDVLDKQMHHQQLRLRSYRTLGLCAGAALTILLI